MNRTIYTLLAVFVLAFAVGCAKTENATTTTTSSDVNNVPSSKAVVAPSSPVAVEAKPAFRAELATEPAAVKAGEPATLVINVKDAAGAPVRGLDIVHEKPMHLLVVSKDLAEFYHIHPEPQADGSYRVTHTFPNGGDYKLYADFTPSGAPQVVERLSVKVAGGERAPVALVEDTTGTKTVGGLRVVMRPDKPLRAGEELMLNFAVADAKTGRPAIDLEPYLGALAHFVIISEDSTDFIHAHPMEKGEHMAAMGAGGEEKGSSSGGGGGHESMTHAHGAAMSGGMKVAAPVGGSSRAAAAATAGASEVAAHTTFPRAGLYKVWAQFKRGGQVIIVPYVVRVAAGEKAVADASNNSSGPDQREPVGAIKINVSAAGYQPARISVKKGQPVRLAFDRADDNNCGGKVFFPSLKLERTLIVGRTTAVDITPEHTGDLAFTCGMSMLRGTLVVE